MAGTEHIISMEELLTRKVNVVRTGAHETSRGNDGQPIIADEETQRMSSIEVFQVTAKACSTSREQRFERLEKAGDNNCRKTPGPKIQKVSFLLRDNKNIEKYFEPRIVSLGPIHHGKEKYQRAEESKLVLANKFVKESGQGKKAESLYVEIEKKIKQLREFFDEEVTKKYDDEDLAWMLFVDGCAVLQFIYYAVEEKFEDVRIKNDQASFGQEDLFLLENQLPYQLLKDLMKLSEKKESLKKSIISFIDMHANMPKKPKNADRKEKPAHLLDRLRTRLLGSVGKVGDQDKRGYDKSKNGGHKEVQSFRNVQELRAAGIYLKASTDSLLTNVTFNEKSRFFPGFLSLPPIEVDDSTGSKFLNLIAYEMCPDFDNDFGVTSYICFLDSLIDHPEDVKELRQAKILHNMLGSDKEVAKLFNVIGTDLVPSPKAYSHVKDQIQKCCNNKWKTWIAQGYHDHFSSPWTFLAFAAAIVALVLSGFQTWYSAHPAGGN